MMKFDKSLAGDYLCRLSKTPDKGEENHGI
jgi:hypothetical protein